LEIGGINMQRQIELLGKQYITTLSDHIGDHFLKVGEEKRQPACLTLGNNFHGTIQLGSQKADLQMVVKGETAYIRAFDRTFALSVIDPVEQASRQAGGRKDTALAPMPGIVVEVHAAIGDKVVKGQPLLTIESMKILTVITSPRDGEVLMINFEQGRTFDKNAVLVTLKKKEGVQDAPN